MINSILMVCVGNICRSPMAEGLIARDLPIVHVQSAGIGALIGQKADPQAVELMNERGINISNHIARQISNLDCIRADIILVMDGAQRRYIESRYPAVRGKVFRITESIKQDVPDPFRETRVVFENSLALIEQGVSFWVDRIKKITEKERQFT